MKTLGNKLVALVVIVTLAVIASLMNPKRAVAEPSGSTGQPGAPVNIVGPLPVPISGAVTVSGTVAATQSGPWNVGISGTPSVNIASAPAFSVAPTALVFDQILSLGATQTIASPPLDVRGFKSLRLLISNISGLPGASVSVVYWGPGGPTQVEDSPTTSTKTYGDLAAQTINLTVHGNQVGSSSVEVIAFGRAN